MASVEWDEIVVSEGLVETMEPESRDYLIKADLKTRPHGPFVVDEFETAHGDRAIGYVLEDGNSLSGVNKHNNGFTKTVAMISKYPFSVVKEMPTSGPYAGKVIYVVEPEKPFKFTELPLEIQNMILELVLPQGSRITVVKDQDEPRSRRAMLKTTSAIRHIAAPIYYGNNTFWLRSSQDAHFLLSSAGPNAGFITNLTVETWTLSNGVRLIHKLMDLRAPIEGETTNDSTDVIQSRATINNTSRSVHATLVLAPTTRRFKKLNVPGSALYDFVAVAKTWVEKQGNTVAAVNQIMHLVSVRHSSNCDEIRFSGQTVHCNHSRARRNELNQNHLLEFLLEGTVEETPDMTDKGRKKTRLEKELEIDMVV